MELNTVGSALAETPESSTTTEATPPFLVVSIRKFLLLYISTFGLYRVYWFYTNWRLQKQFNRETTWPVARTVLAVFFVYDSSSA